MHNVAVELFWQCRCACHRLRDPLVAHLCWCTPRRTLEGEVDQDALTALREHATRVGLWPDSPAIAHNEAVEVLGRCPDRSHQDKSVRCRCSGRTDPQVATYLNRKRDRDLRRRLETGRATPAEYLKHAPWVLTGRGRPGQG